MMAFNIFGAATYLARAFNQSSVLKRFGYSLVSFALSRVFCISLVCVLLVTIPTGWSKVL